MKFLLKAFRPLSMILKNPTFEVSFIVATLDPYSDSNSTVASTTSAAKIVSKTKTNGATDEDFEAMETENWEHDDLSTNESSFADLLEKAKSDKENIDVVPRSPESPRSKKARLVFGRCYDPTFHETILGEVLAANSDSE